MNKQTQPTAISEPEDNNGPSADNICERIVFALRLYPRMSSSMIQQTMAGLRPQFWKPYLHELVSEGVIVRSHGVFTTPTGRNQNYTFFSLSEDEDVITQKFPSVDDITISAIQPE